jgi:hypothetical protein
MKAGSAYISKGVRSPQLEVEAWEDVKVGTEEGDR